MRQIRWNSVVECTIVSLHEAKVPFFNPTHQIFAGDGQHLQFRDPLREQTKGSTRIPSGGEPHANTTIRASSSPVTLGLGSRVCGQL